MCVCTHWPAEHHSSSVDSDPALQFVRPHCVHQYPAEALWGEKGREKRGFCHLKSFLLLMLKSTRHAQKLLYVCVFLPSLPASSSVRSCSMSHFSTRCPAGCSAMWSCSTSRAKSEEQQERRQTISNAVYFSSSFLRTALLASFGYHRTNTKWKKCIVFLQIVLLDKWKSTATVAVNIRYMLTLSC